jgi:hypothetical protein
VFEAPIHSEITTFLLESVGISTSTTLVFIRHLCLTMGYVALSLVSRVRCRRCLMIFTYVTCKNRFFFKSFSTNFTRMSWNWLRRSRGDELTTKIILWERIAVMTFRTIALVVISLAMRDHGLTQSFNLIIILGTERTFCVIRVLIRHTVRNLSYAHSPLSVFTPPNMPHNFLCILLWCKTDSLLHSDGIYRVVACDHFCMTNSLSLCSLSVSLMKRNWRYIQDTDCYRCQGHDRYRACDSN